MRILLVTVLLAVAQLPVAFGQSQDLYLPGALTTLARNNPGHHAKVREILVDIQGRSVSEVPVWMWTSFGADNVVYQDLLLVSLPPKRRLSFSLDGVRYEAIITEQNAGAVLQEASLLDERGDREAVKTYMRAARLGSAQAAKRLATIYADGLLGVPRDDKEARKWRHESNTIKRR
jgi:hypothetical protein